MRNKGITLVALVVTIIIMLILVGVTIGLITGDNGLFNKAQKAVDIYQVENEREAIGISVTTYKLGEYTENKYEKLGESLVDKSLETTLNWHIIKIDGERYSTGWNYIEEGTDIEGYGKAKNNWLVNYETGEIIKLEKDKYISLSAGDMLEVKDSIIINVDSTIVDSDVKNNEEELEERLGQGVDLVNFNYNNESGLTSTSFNFDGVDDYITVEYDSEEQKNLLASRGFTFEFYGIWDGGQSYKIVDKEKNIEEKVDHPTKGLFCYWNGDNYDWSIFRFAINNEKRIQWSATSGTMGCKAKSDFCFSDTPWNVAYDISTYGFQRNKLCYITITLDTSESVKINNKKGKHSNGTEFDKNGEFYKCRCYVNGTKAYDVDFNKEQWDTFKEKCLDDLKYFCIGRINTGDNYHGWNYSKLNCYVLRLYSRGLTEEEVNKNYEKSVEYHSLY